MRKNCYPLTIYSIANYPENGWVIDGKIIHPPSAYTDKIAFIKGVLNHFPNKKEEFLSMFNGNELRMYFLKEKATHKLCEWLNKKSKFII